jgi:hypothetical protein
MALPGTGHGRLPKRSDGNRSGAGVSQGGRAALSLRVLRELRPQPHGEFTFVLADGTELRSGRSYRARIEAALGLA